MPSYVQRALRQTPLPPSRQGKVHVGAYLPAGFKRGIRMLQATTGEDLQSILARALNEQFRLHNLPEVGQGRDKPTCAQV
jgi:antitoxin-like ribbon-helix-helix protein